MGVKTGIDVSGEALGYKGSEPIAGNLLHFAIGQYDTYTTLQLAQYGSTIANGGKRIQPHFFLESFIEDEEEGYISLSQNKIKILDDVSSNKTALMRVEPNSIPK